MNIKNVFQEIGLGRTKGDVYLAALELGTGSAEEIARKATVPRTTAHEILQQLLSLGLVSLSTKGRTRIYTAEPPTKLKKMLQEKERRLEKVLPELELLMNTTGLRPRVRFYEGIEGVKTVFEDTMTAKNKLLHGILSMEDLYDIPGKRFMDEYVRRRVSSDIWLKVIRSKIKEVEETWPTSREEKRELRYAPSYMVFTMTMYLYDNKVSIVSTKREQFGMIIESTDLYRTLKIFFDAVWNLSRATTHAHK